MKSLAFRWMGAPYSPEDLKSGHSLELAGWAKKLFDFGSDANRACPHVLLKTPDFVLILACCIPTRNSSREPVCPAETAKEPGAAVA